MTGHATGPFVAIDNPNPRPSTRGRANLTLVRVDGKAPGSDDPIEAPSGDDPIETLRAKLESEALRIYHDRKQGDTSVMVHAPTGYTVEELGEALLKLTEMGYSCTPSAGWDRIIITLPADKLS